MSSLMVAIHSTLIQKDVVNHYKTRVYCTSVWVCPVVKKVLSMDHHSCLVVILMHGLSYSQSCRLYRPKLRTTNQYGTVDDGVFMMQCCEWVGPGGAGHFVKTVHNGIEYGDIQLICEGKHTCYNDINL